MHVISLRYILFPDQGIKQDWATQQIVLSSSKQSFKLVGLVIHNK
jgi:hypothetical protein